MAEFGELLAELRKDQKITQKELAEKIFVTSGTISNYEKGVHFPDIKKLISIADFFHVTTDYLLGRCSNSVSPDSLDETVFRNITAGQILEDIKELPPDRKTALVIVLNDMKLSRSISRLNHDMEELR